MAAEIELPGLTLERLDELRARAREIVRANGLNSRLLGTFEDCRIRNDVMIAEGRDPMNPYK